MVLDFNNAPLQSAEAPQAPQWAEGQGYTRDEVFNSLTARLESVLGYLYPNGFADKKGRKFYIGSIEGEEGESLSIELEGQKAGLWHDFATGEGGDIFDLWKAARGLASFRETLKDAGEYTGATISTPRKSPTRKNPKGGEAWGKPSITYKYQDANGKLVAEIDRFDWEKDGEAKKTFRPWDVARRSYTHPEHRPLYNLPNIIRAPEIVIVEGEKSADALIAQNIDATTAMGGSNAPLEKTDWTALKGRKVVIWPDNDDAGKAYAERLKVYLEGQGVLAVSVLSVPASRPHKWDAADADDEDLGALIRSMRSEASALKSDVSRSIPLEWFDTIQAAISAPYMIKGVLDQGAMSVVYGPSNSGKTFFAMDLAYHLSAGIKWRDRRVLQSGVLYLAAEGGRGAANRLVALRNETGLSGLPFALRRAGLNLLKDEQDIEQIVKLSDEVKTASGGLPLLIVIDTLSRVMAGGDENTPTDMTALIKNIDRIREATGAHVMMVHHSGKDTAKGARGHSSLRAATDTEIEVQDTDGFRQALVTKQRDHEGGQDFGFSLKSVLLGNDQDGDEITSCVVEVANSDGGKRRAKRLTANQMKVVETFDQMLAEGLGKPNPGGVMMPEPGSVKTVQMDEFLALGRGKFATKNPSDSFLKAFDAMTGQNGLFCLAHGLVWRVNSTNK